MSSCSISVVSWNTHGLPWPFDLHVAPWSRIPRHRARGRKILNLILHRRPEVVALQEVWTSGDLGVFATELRRAGYWVLDRPRGCFPRPGGLITAVRGWNAERHEFTHYKATAP